MRHIVFTRGGFAHRLRQPSLHRIGRGRRRISRGGGPHITGGEAAPGAATEAVPPMPVRLGTPLAQISQNFGGMELPMTRDQAPVEPASFE